MTELFYWKEMERRARPAQAMEFSSPAGTAIQCGLAAAAYGS
jgi:hypothetical protein